MSTIVEVRKSKVFSNEKPFVTVRFRKSQHDSKFAVGNINEGASYSTTYNLAPIYPEYVNDEGEFDAKEAWKAFKSEMKVGGEEPINCYDITIEELCGSPAVYVRETKRVMQTMRPACYGTREDAVRIAKASLERQLRDKKFRLMDGTEPEDDADDDDDDEEK